MRDFDPSLGIAESFRDGGFAFGFWHGARRLKQQAADAVRPLLGPGAYLTTANRGEAHQAD